MSRTGPKKVIDIHVRAGEDLAGRFYALTDRLPGELTPSDAVRRSILIFVRLGEAAPKDLHGDAFTAWIEGHVASLLLQIRGTLTVGAGPSRPIATQDAPGEPSVSRSRTKVPKR